MSDIVEQLTALIQQRAVVLVRLAADTAVAMTQAGTSRRTGELADGISHDEPVLSDPYVTCNITSAATYSSFQNEGTGLFGPSGARIFPTSAKALRFDWPAAGGIVFAKSVAGSPGTHFWDRLVDYWPQSLFENADVFAG